MPDVLSCLMHVWYRKRPRLDRDDGTEAEDVTVKSEPLIPGLDLVDDADVKDEDILDTGALCFIHSKNFK